MKEKNKMKICYIADLGSIHARRWAEWFVNRGHEVHVISPGEQKVTIERNVHIHKPNIENCSTIIKKLPFKSKWIDIWLCRKVIKEINPDIVHGHFITNSGLPTIFSGNYPKVVSAWGSDVLIIPKESMKERLKLKYVLRKVDIIHSFAENLTDELISLGADKEKIVTISPSVNTQNFNPDNDGSKIRKLLDWDNNPIVISTRAFKPIYDIECLINAIPIITKKIPNARFIIKGEGFSENKLKTMVKELGISDSVKFIGYVQYNELANYLSCADVYVSTSLSEGLGISNLEAIACGLPAILADITSTRNLMKKGLSITLFPPKNSKILAEKIIYSIKNRESEEIKKENFQIIKENFDYNINMKKIEQSYKNLIERLSRK
ncbi:MAG: hypothetical protein CVU81_01000 [Euryarchaeota archaeon HGW-Euryarchaeota-1]|nr:MAG: hypothetical protein CVU81_01000 [Euryarchaeota archaeon HGW-Euryarchaeota-1]